MLQAQPCLHRLQQETLVLFDSQLISEQVLLESQGRQGDD